MEIERKYMIDEIPADIGKYEAVEIEQAYLDGKPALRIRKWNDKYIMTYKSDKEFLKSGIKTTAVVNEEIEIPMPRDIFLHLLKKKVGHIVKKTRYLIPLDEDHTIELDVFHGRLKGLVFAEVEFKSIEDADSFVPPEWFGKELSGDRTYTNRSLSKIDRYKKQ